MQAALGQDFSVVVVDNGAAALAALAQGVFDLVLLDIEMPEMDGFAVCAEIRQQSEGKLPIVLITGYNDERFGARAAALGAGHIAKPVDWSRLAARLQAFLAATSLPENGAARFQRSGPRLQVSCTRTVPRCELGQ